MLPISRGILHASQPALEEVRKILGEHDGKVDVVIIAEQEGPRSTTKSLGVKVAHALKPSSSAQGKEILDEFTGHHRQKFETFTAGHRGAVASTVLSNHPITFDSGAEQDPAQKNKGGIYQKMMVCGRPLQTVSAHLEPFLPKNRFSEVSTLMRVIRPPDKNYDDLVKLASTPVLFGGDLNYRDTLTRKDDVVAVVDPMLNKNGPMRHFQFQGLHEARMTTRDMSAVTYASTKQKYEGMEDPKRAGDVMRGDLNRVFVSGPTSSIVARSIVEGTTSSDHKPVVVIANFKKSTDDFATVKEFVCAMVHDLAPGAQHEAVGKIIERVSNLSDSQENKAMIFKIYTSCKILQDNCLQEQKEIVSLLQHDAELKRQLELAKQETKPFYKNESDWNAEQTKHQTELSDQLSKVLNKLHTCDEKWCDLFDKAANAINKILSDQVSIDALKKSKMTLFSGLSRPTQEHPHSEEPSLPTPKLS